MSKLNEAELGRAIRELRAASAAVVAASEQLRQRVVASLLDADDRELGFIELWHSAIDEELERMKTANDAAWDLTTKRAVLVIENNHGEGVNSFEAFGRKFTAYPDLLPTPPKRGTTEWDEFANYLAESDVARELDPVIREKAGFRELKKLCERLADLGMPTPPHVKISPRVRLGVRQPKQAGEAKETSQ